MHLSLNEVQLGEALMLVSFFDTYGAILQSRLLNLIPEIAIVKYLYVNS